MNTLTINIDGLTISLPESHIIVEKSEFEKLQKASEIGHYLSMNQVLEMISVSRPWLIENVLYKTNIINQIDIDKNPDGFVKYPVSQGGRYYFLASKTKEYFETHFRDIMNKK